MIYCCGEALIDMIPLTTPAGQAYLPVSGGASWNAAVALGRLQARVGLIAAFSQDAFGQRLLAEAEAAGVDTGLSPLLARPTALALITPRPEGGQDFSIRDAETAGRMVTTAALQSPEGAEAALFGGISLVVEPSGSAFEALFEALPPATLRVIDPNIRPLLIEDPAAVRARLARMAAGADILKLSEEDLAWLTPDPARHIAEQMAAGRLMICETLGAAGIRLHLPGRVLHFGTREVEVVDTVGAGDIFTAGFLAGLQQMGLLERRALAAASEAQLARALRLGLDAAALSVTRQGANPPSLAEVEAFAAKAPPPRAPAIP